MAYYSDKGVDMAQASRSKQTRKPEQESQAPGQPVYLESRQNQFLSLKLSESVKLNILNNGLPVTSIYRDRGPTFLICDGNVNLCCHCGQPVIWQGDI